MSSDLEIYCELRIACQSMKSCGELDNYISFLRYCAERLKDGAPAQEIWNDYSRNILAIGGNSHLHENIGRESARANNKAYIREV